MFVAWKITHFVAKCTIWLKPSYVCILLCHLELSHHWTFFFFLSSPPPPNPLTFVNSSFSTHQNFALCEPIPNVHVFHGCIHCLFTQQPFYIFYIFLLLVNSKGKKIYKISFYNAAVCVCSVMYPAGQRLWFNLHFIIGYHTKWFPKDVYENRSCR